MIIENHHQLTEAVVETMQRTPDPRLREIMTSLAKHLHGFVRETRLTEREWEKAVGSIVRLANSPTTPTMKSC